MALPSLGEEEMFKFDVSTNLYCRLVDGTVTPELIAQTKAIVGEECVAAVMKQVEGMTAEQKQAVIDYTKQYK